jgi:hypothetical protein
MQQSLAATPLSHVLSCMTQKASARPREYERRRADRNLGGKRAAEMSQGAPFAFFSGLEVLSGPAEFRVLMLN